MRIVKENPNAAAAAGSGVGGGVVVVWLLGLAGVTVSAVTGAAIAGACATVFLFIGRRGIRGVARMVWRGSDA